MNLGQVIVDGGLWLALPLAIAAGAFSFLSPCVLPLIPGYLGYLGGAVQPRPRQTPAGEKPQHPARARLVLGVLLFISGFTIVFVTVTILGGAMGYLLLEYANVLTRILGAIVILLGLTFIGLFGLAQRTIRPRFTTKAGLLGAPLLGLALGIGWTPCIGPTLAAIISVSWNLGDPARAGLLGLAYSLGLGVPFLLVALGMGWATRSMGFFRRHIRVFNIAGGGLLVVLGVLMVSGLWSMFMSALQQVMVNVPLPL